LTRLKQTTAVNKSLCTGSLLGDLGKLDLTGIDWVVVGGECETNFRPCTEEWVINLRDQCEEQGVAFTFKQWGGRFSKRNGSLLQGKYYHEMPVSNQVRIYNSDRWFACEVLHVILNGCHRFGKIPITIQIQKIG